MTAEEIGSVRHILKKYGRGKYQFIAAEGTSAWKEDLKSAIVPLGLLILGIFMFFYRTWMIDTGKISDWYQESRYGVYTGEPNIGTPWSDTEPEEGPGDTEQDSDTPEMQEHKDSVFVFTPDQSALHLSARELRLEDCYSDNTVNQKSRFFI